ncbi:hypothetical protein [Streptomyces sp. OE57]|uniref:hypothetical protein n=1 Tax=Streptomyces lacaronensis TaxID=3379885 RepID=UPI0039B75B27
MKVPEVVRDAVYRTVMDEADLDRAELRLAFDALLDVEDVRIRAALCATLSTALMQRGPRTHEVVALWDVLLEREGHHRNRTYVEALPDRGRVVTLMGSGKKGIRCLNISTPSSLLAAAAGAAVAKIGANCTSRITSSIELVALLGVNLELGEDAMLEVLNRTGYGYFRGGDAMAPMFFDTYKGTCVAPHALMFGWPLLAPIRTDAFMYGLTHWNVRTSAEVVDHFELAGERGTVVSSRSGDARLDEALPFGTTHLCSVSEGRVALPKQHRFDVELDLAPSAGLDLAGSGRLDELLARGTTTEDIAVTVRTLAGKGSRTYGDALALNAALIAEAGGVAPDVPTGFALCRSALDRGLALDKLREVVEATGGDQRALKRWL